MIRSQLEQPSFSYVEMLSIQHLRNISHSLIHLSPSINIIYGKNGAGKSSFCEALSLLFHGRSFRPSVHFSNIIQSHHEGIQIQARLATSNFETKLSMEKKKEGSWQVKQDGENVNKLKDLTKLLPLLIMSPDIENIVDTDPSGRRKLVDWLMFHVEHDYADVFQKYNYALKQRNKLLKSHHKTKEELESWTKELVDAGNHIHQLRSKVMSQVSQYLENALIGTQFSGCHIDLYAGWDESQDLNEALNRMSQEEHFRKTTLAGPHRADLIIKNESATLIKPLFSRGEKKRLSLFINLALIGFLNEVLGKKSLLIVDDWYSELDRDGRSFVLQQVDQNGMQVILTTTDLDESENLPADSKMFHVEHGQFSEIGTSVVNY